MFNGLHRASSTYCFSEYANFRQVMLSVINAASGLLDNLELEALMTFNKPMRSARLEQSITSKSFVVSAQQNSKASSKWKKIVVVVFTIYLSSSTFSISNCDLELVLDNKKCHALHTFFKLSKCWLFGMEIFSGKHSSRRSFKTI